MMAENILEVIVGLCEELQATPGTTGKQRALRSIRDIASRHANVLTQILDDYIRQNEEDPTYRKNRLKGARKMLGIA